MSDDNMMATSDALSLDGDGDPNESSLQDDKSHGDSLVESAADEELEAIKARIAEMQAESDNLKAKQTEVDQSLNGMPQGSFPTWEEKLDADSRSVYVGNVDYESTAEQLENHFNGCGPVSRVTILCDKYTGHPKGFAFIEFDDKDSVPLAVTLNDSLFRGRQIQVSAKRTNKPGISTTNRVQRGRGRSRFSGRGGYRGYMRGYRGGYSRRGRGSYYGYTPY